MSITAATSVPAAGRRIRRRAGVSLVLAVFALVTIGPIVTTVSAQPASRYAATAAWAEHRSVDLTPYRAILGIDKARYEGEWRSDKAPGQPFLGAPLYAVGRVIGFRPASQMRVHGDLGVWWQTLWFAMVPFVVLLVLMYRAAARFAPSHALPATLAIGFGTLMLPHAVNLYGHALAAVLAYACWLIVERCDGARRQLAIAGFVGGCAFAVEYHVAIVVAVLSVFVGLNWKRRGVAWFTVGLVGPALATAAYQRAAFGAPWHLAYSYLVPRANGGSYELPGIGSMADLVAGRHGLVLTSPIVLLAVAAAVLAVRHATGALRTHAVIALAVLVPYVLLVTSWTGTALLEQPGPRYMIPALPFLAVPLAVAWQRFSRLAVALTLWGLVVMVSGAFVYHLVATADTPMRAYAHEISRGRFEPTLWSMAFGDVGIVLHVATIAAAGAWLSHAWRTRAQRA